MVVNEPTLEALMLVASQAEGESRLSDDDLLDMIQSAGLRPRILYPSGFKREIPLRLRDPPAVPSTSAM